MWSTLTKGSPPRLHFIPLAFSNKRLAADWDALRTMQVVEKTIRPCLVELSEDPDVDVRFFATQALQSSDQVMMST